MPGLPMEPSCYPASLFDEGDEGGDRSWWVLHTKPRQEKAVARQLLQVRIPFYLPLIEHKSIIRGRVMRSHIPLFSGYVFLLGTAEERITALATKRIVQTLKVIGQKELWQDLGRVNRLITSGLPVTPEQRLYPGVDVEIRMGPLAGLKGKIIREASRRRFVVQVDFIQKGASVWLDDYMLAAAKV